MTRLHCKKKKNEKPSDSVRANNRQLICGRLLYEVFFNSVYIYVIFLYLPWRSGDFGFGADIAD